MDNIHYLLRKYWIFFSLTFCPMGLYFIYQGSGPNPRALAMKSWDRFHQSGKESAKMTLILDFTVIGTLLFLDFPP